MQQMKIVKRLIYASGLVLLLACNSDDAPSNSDDGDSLLTPKLTVTESDYKGYFHLDASGSSAQAPYQITNQSLRVTDDTGQVVFEHEFEDDNDSLRRHFDKGHYNAVLTTSAAAENTDSTDALISSSNVSFSSDTTSCAFNGSSCEWNCTVDDENPSQVTCIPSAVDGAECHYDSLFNVLQIVNLVCVPDQTFDTSTPVWLRAYGGSGAGSENHGTQGFGGFAQTVTTLDDLQARFGDYSIYFATGKQNQYSKGGAATIISGNPPTQSGSDDDLSYSFAMSDIIALAGGGGVVGQDAADGASNGGHAASMRVGYCATSQGQDAISSDDSDNDDSGGFGGGSDTYDEDITNDSDYCSDEMLTIHAVGGSESGNDGIGGKGGGDTGWSNFDDLNTYWGGDGDGGEETGCSGGGGFGGGGACDGDADLGGGGGGGSFAMAPTVVDFDAYDSDSSNYGIGYIAVIFNASPSENEGYCQLSCSGYGDPDDNGSYSQAICQPLDASYDTHECNSLNLTYVIDSLNSMDILNATASSSSSIWLRAYGAAGTDGKETNIAGSGAGGSGGIAQTVISLDSYQTKYGTDDIYFLLGDKSSSNGGSGSSTLVTTIPALYNRHVDLAGTLLVAGAGGGGGSAVGNMGGKKGGDAGLAISYVADECSITQGEDAVAKDAGTDYGGGGGGTSLSIDDLAYCNLSSSTNQAFILALASAGEGKGNAGSSGIGGLGATHSDAASVLWMNNERLSENWVGTGNGGEGYSGSSTSGASGAGGGGYGGGGGGKSKAGFGGAGGGGGGSYAASPLTTDYDACDTSQDNCGLSINTQDPDYSGVGYIEIIVNVSPQTSAPDD